MRLYSKVAPMSALAVISFLVTSFAHAMIQNGVHPADYYVELSAAQEAFLQAEGFSEFTGAGGVYFTDQDKKMFVDFASMSGTVDLLKDPNAPATNQNGGNPVIGLVGRVPIDASTWETWFISGTNKKIRLSDGKSPVSI